jgi:hypothetical protein
MLKILVQLPGLNIFVGIEILVRVYSNVNIGSVPLSIRILYSGGLIMLLD